MTGGREITSRFNKFFSGRESELAALHNALNNGGTAAVTQAVSGLGGIGKTALAVEYAHRYGAEYDHRLFCLADSPASLSAGYRAVASEVGLPVSADAKDDEVVTLVKEWLETTPRTLLILDNADFGDKLTPEQLKTFLPTPPKGHVLITTRAQTLNMDLGILPKNVLRLDVLSAEDALVFLMKTVEGDGRTINGDELSAAQELAEELGYLALALEQAAAYIRQQGRTFRLYLNLYRKYPVKQIEKAKPQVSNSEKTVATTWGISFDEVERVCPAATELLTLSAYLAPDDIPIEVVYAAAQGALPHVQTFFTDVTDADEIQERCTDLLEPLTRYSLVSVNADTLTYSVHRLVQAVVRHHQSGDEQTQSQVTAINVLNAAFPFVEYQNWGVCQRLLPCASVAATYANVPECRTETTSRLLNQMGYYLNEQGRYGDALPLFKEALTIRRAVLPYPHNNIATSLNNLAGLYEAQGRYGDALPLYEEALTICRAVLPYPHNDIATSLNNLAGLYYAEGRYGDALPLYEEALTICRAVLPYPHNNIATSLNNLAGLYEAQGRYGDALPLYEEALTIRRAVLPYPHNDIATSLNNLAVLYRAQGRYGDALPLYKEALTIRRAVLPYPHNDIAISLNNLAVLYEAQGRYGDALPLYEEAVEIMKRVLGADHPHTKQIIASRLACWAEM